MENTFKAHMISTYSHNEMADMANHGANTGHHGLIWTKDLIDLFNTHNEALFAIMADYSDATGEKGLPAYVNERSDAFDNFAGAVVYFCAEWVAHEFTQGEYTSEE